MNRVPPVLHSTAANQALARQIAAQVVALHSSTMTVATTYAFVMTALQLLNTNRSLNDADRKMVVIDTLLIVAFQANLSDAELDTITQVADGIIDAFVDVYAHRVVIVHDAESVWKKLVSCCACAGSGTKSNLVIIAKGT